MAELLENVGFITLAVIYAAGFFVLFPLSVIKCAGGWNNRNKILSVIIMILLNPVTVMLTVIVVGARITGWLLYPNFPCMQDYAVYYTVDGIIAAVMILLLGLLCSRLLSGFFGIKDRFLIAFLFQIFQLFIFIMDNNAETIDINDSIGWSIFSVVWNIMPAVAFAFFYTQIVLPLSRISKNGIRADKKIFVIPVSILIAVYSVITNYIGLNKTSLNMAIEYAYSAIVMCLVMWAFAVIIRNIAATNEAIEAKDEAVEAQNQIKELSVEVMEALAHTIDAKDEYTRGHSVRVAEYSRMIAERMKLSQEECEDAYYMGLLHDLGKIGVPNEIINSPTRLTDKQYDVIKVHPVTGFDILAEIKTRPDLVIGARWHHERYDGKGYPDGKSGEDIPLMARIIAVADSYDAMTSNRSYRKYMAQEKVRSEIEKNSGTQFDPIIAKVMIEIIDDDKDYLLHE